MPKPKTTYICQSCGGHSVRWAGQCPECGEWNTLAESVVAPQKSASRAPRGYAGETRVRLLGEVGAEAISRTPTGLVELDRVFGGGLVLGSVALIGGDPGIGKSTLLMQAASHLSADEPVLYVTGEESLTQIGLRARRLEVAVDRLAVVAETCVERIVAMAEAEQPRVLIVDSIQTIFTEALNSAPGAVAQLRESAAQLVRFAKRSGTAVLLVGHVTKEGAIAGPRVLEHMVDTVLYFENDAGSRYRVVRAVKNRFGAANELGVFAMTETGLKEVKNPSAIFLARHPEPVSGSCVTVIREGSRPLLIEVQALVDESALSNPRRVAVGFDANRLGMLLAVLHRHAGIAAAGLDVFVNAVGGLRISETAADLPIVLAVLSSLRDKPLPAGLIAFGEIGLAGEIRPVYNGEERLAEAAKQGVKQAIIPAANAPRMPLAGMTVTPVRRLAEACEL
jgi:DNA repair protein RadA/Sms